jgi:hypothetical protein
MVDDLAGDRDGAAGRSIVSGDKERTSPETGTARLAAASSASSAEARKGT